MWGRGCGAKEDNHFHVALQRDSSHLAFTHHGRQALHRSYLLTWFLYLMLEAASPVLSRLTQCFQYPVHPIGTYQTLGREDKSVCFNSLNCTVWKMKPVSNMV